MSIEFLLFIGMSAFNAIAKFSFFTFHKMTMVTPRNTETNIFFAAAAAVLFRRLFNTKIN